MSEKCAVAFTVGSATLPWMLPLACSCPRLSGEIRLRSSACTAKRRSNSSARVDAAASVAGAWGVVRLPSRAMWVRPSPIRTPSNCQAPAWRASFPPPLAATPRSLPLKLRSSMLKSRESENPRPWAAMAKLSAPGRSSRKCAGFIPVSVPLTSQLCSGPQTTSPSRSACPSYASREACLNSKRSLASVPSTRPGICGKPFTTATPLRCTV